MNPWLAFSLGAAFGVVVTVVVMIVVARALTHIDPTNVGTQYW